MIASVAAPTNHCNPRFLFVLAHNLLHDGSHPFDRQLVDGFRHKSLVVHRLEPSRMRIQRRCGAGFLFTLTFFAALFEKAVILTAWTPT